jgi:hypothetical protein
MKRLTMYLSIIVALCFFNLVAIEAQVAPNQTNPITPQLVVNQGGGGYAQVSIAKDPRTSQERQMDKLKEDIENAIASYKAACELAVSNCIKAILSVTGEE